MQTQRVEVEFKIHYQCFYGQTVYVSGSANELGAWRVKIKSLHYLQQIGTRCKRSKME